jgi:outer membrane receptor protein involved in Fe transport
MHRHPSFGRARRVFHFALILSAVISQTFVADAGVRGARDEGDAPDAASRPRGVRPQDLDDVSISGVVADQAGGRVGGALVTVTHAATGLARAVAADGEGRYRLVELPPGVYEVRAAAAGFADAVKTNLSTAAGQNVRLDFTLMPAGVVAEQTVTGDADAPVVDTTRTVAGGALTRDELEGLPVATRNALDLVLTLGGSTEEPLSTRDVAEDADAGGGRERAAQTPEEAGVFSLSGGPAYSNNLTIDGLDNNDDRAARERFAPPLESIEEVQIITSQFSAEYGRASGGRVNLRTRGGARDFRGRAFHFFRDESLDANSWNNNRRGLKRLPFQEHVAGFTLGGPLILPGAPGPLSYDGRRRGSFVFLAYEYRTVLDSALIDALVPVERNPSFPLPAPTTLAGRRFEPSATAPHAPAELAPFVERVSTPSREHALTARLDQRFTEAHNGTFVLQLGRSKNLRQFGGGLRLADALQGRGRDTEALSFTDNFVFNATAVNQLRAQVSRLRPSFTARAGAARPVVLIAINDPLDPSDPFDRSGMLVAGSSTAGSSDRRETRFQLQETLTLLRGAHALKVGADLHRVRSTFVDLADATGTYNFTSAGDFLAGAASRFRQRFNTESEQRNLYTGFFVQDEWRPRQNLTLNFGLRYESESVLGDRDNFGPRLGLALDPFGTGKTVLRAGAGLFYNRALLRTIDDFTLGAGVVEFDTNSLPVAARRVFISERLRFPETLTADSPLVREFGARETDFARRLDPDLRIPESYQFHAGFEREVGRGFVVEAGFTYNRGVHLWREFNANAPRLPAGFRDFAEYLSTRDFANFRDAAGARPVHDTTTAGDLVRFTFAPAGAAASRRVVEFGVPVTVFNLNSVNSTSALDAALAALRPLRPDPSRMQLEQLASIGNSFYRGLTVEARRRFSRVGAGFGLSLRAAYTLSRLVDDGVVNTSSALRAGDFRSERARSLLDRRHRLAFTGALDAPRALGALRLAAVLRAGSGAPFNLSLGGADRNLDDVGNDRPVFTGDLDLIRHRRPGAPLDPRLVEAFSPPAVGRTGNLPRNAGRGPAFYTFDVSLAREFRLAGRARLRPVVEVDNALNAAVFTFGAEFINLNALGPDATPEQRRAFLDTFLVPTRTLRPRAIRLGVKLDF